MQKIFLITILFSVCFTQENKTLGSIDGTTLILTNTRSCDDDDKDKCCFVEDVVITINYDINKKVESITYKGKQKDDSCPQQLINYPNTAEYTADTSIYDTKFSNKLKEEYTNLVLHFGGIMEWGILCNYDIFQLKTDLKYDSQQNLLHPDQFDACKKLIDIKKDPKVAAELDKAIMDEIEKESAEKQKAEKAKNDLMLQKQREMSSSCLLRNNIILFISLSLIFYFAF